MGEGSDANYFDDEATWNLTKNDTTTISFPTKAFKIKPGYLPRINSDAYTYSYIVLACLIAVIAIVGNLLLSVTILKKKKLRTPTNLLLLSLVSGDLLTVLLLVPIYLERFIHQDSDHSDRNLCILRKYLYIATSSGSLISLAVVSFDRMLAISNPFKYSHWITKRVACLTIVGIWVWTICFNAITFHSFIDWGQILDTCVGGIPQTLFLIVTPSGFYLPGLIIIVVYVKIYLVARKSNKKIQHTRISTTSNDYFLAELSISTTSIPSSKSQEISQSHLSTGWATKRRRSSLPELVTTTKQDRSPIETRRLRSSTTLSQNDSPPDTRRQRSATTLSVSTITKSRSATIISQTLHEGKEKILKAKRSIARDIRTVKTIAMLVGLFLLCWFPTAGFHLYINIKGIESYKNQSLLLHNEIFTLMSFVNCAIDPYLYTFRNVELRRATSQTLRDLLKMFKRDEY